MTALAPRELFRPERLLAFSDGVFAVAITLLVLDLRLPAGVEHGGDAALVNELLGMGPKLLLFCFTFIIIGMSWLGHHRKFNYISRVDGLLLWLNLFYLMALCLIPFATDVLGERGTRIGFIVYAVAMALLTLLSAVVSAYGLREPFLGGAGVRPGIRMDMILSPLLTGFVFLAAAGMAFAYWAEFAPWVLFLIIPISAFFGSRDHGGNDPTAGEEDENPV